MRILCLHGIGTSADILSSQTASFRAQLPSHYEYTFVSGEDVCPAADGIESLYAGPYYAYYLVPTVAKLRLAHELVQEIIMESGPFDGILSFSQGSALAASILLHHHIENSLEPQPFRWAVFIGATLPFSTSEELGINVSRVWNPHTPMTGDLKTWIPVDELVPNGTHDPTTADEATQFPAKDGQRQELGMDQLRQFHPDGIPTSPKICVPTAHIYGRKDPYRSQSLQLVRMCDESLSTVFEHDEGHCIPRNQRVSQCIASAIEKTVRRADLGY